NELHSLRAHLDSSQPSKAQMSQMLKAVYDEDFGDAEAIMCSALDKTRKKCEITSGLYESACNLLGKEQSSKSTSRLVSNSKPKGVLLPTSHSMTNVRGSSLLKRSSSLTSLGSSNSTTSSSA